MHSFLTQTYIYGNSQILAQHDGDWRDEEMGKYFYLRQRLGSGRQIINTSAGVVKYYTYEPSSFAKTRITDSISEIWSTLDSK